ncbi:hypothetical protein ACJU26_02870 [Acidithiobacillus sp. M4-SHS-6]|uniref:hypothetical protein n=1 Tax=Acidithiobacillus sp. M4-SHS-6 TaxID=3383024 RepID=UPI0039BE6A34
MTGPRHKRRVRSWLLRIALGLCSLGMVEIGIFSSLRGCSAEVAAVEYLVKRQMEK